MTESLFSFLQKYSPREGRNPREDYLTQLFCWNLNHITEYRKFFCKSLDSEALNLTFDTDVTFDTQRYGGVSGRYDMVMLKNDHIVVIFEHKLDSAVRDGQIEAYQKICPVVLITKYIGARTGVANQELLWSDLHKRTGKFLEQTKLESTDEFLLNQLCDYFVDNGLSDIGDITLQAAYSYLPAKKFIYQLKAILSQWQPHLLDNCPCLGNLNPTHELLKLDGFDDRWGRIGIDTFYEHTEWTPNLFAGVIYDLGDHQLDHFVSEDSIDLMVTIDFNIRHEDREKFKNSPKFQQLKQYLKNNEDYTCDFECTNPWRLLILRKPLTKALIQGQKEGKSSACAITQELENMIKIICDQIYCWWVD